MPRELVIDLEAGDARATVHPERGGRLGSLEVLGRPLLRDDASPSTLLWGCYPMAPWAGRIRHGAFEFDGHRYQMPLDAPPHAIHGTSHLARWDVVDAGRDHCELRCDLDWPLGGIAHQHIVMRPDGIVLLLAVVATTQRMPAVIGWHPCFRPPHSATLEFGAMYRRDAEGIPTGETVGPPPPPWDDCFTTPCAPIVLRYAADGTSPPIDLRLDSDCDHWVVFNELPDALCVEPQSAPPDAHNLGSAAVLEPGELLQRRFEITWHRPPTGG